MPNPTVVLVPGAWLSADIYSGVAAALSGYGYPTVSLALPSTGATPPHNDFTEDVDGIRRCLTRLVVAEQSEVVLVLHSYAGMPGSEAVKGLGKREREGKGQKGGVVRLVFIQAYAMPEGFTPTAGGAQFPLWMLVDAEVR